MKGNIRVTKSNIVKEGQKIENPDIKSQEIQKELFLNKNLIMKNFHNNSTKIAKIYN